MSGPGIDSLKLPLSKYSAARSPRHPITGARFETAAAARLEDQRRERQLLALPADNGLVDLAAAHALAGRLAHRSSWAGRPTSLASAQSMRWARLRLIGELWRIAKRTPLTTFTLIPVGWSVAATELDQFDPARRLAAVRSMLNRAGAGSANGFLLAAIHGEFEPTSASYQLHLHGVAAGEMVDVLDRLRPSLAREKTIKRRLRLSRGPLEHLPFPLSYVLQSYWPSRRIGPVGDGTKIARNRKKQRIPEPHHSQSLTWLSQHTLSDLTLLLNVRVVRGQLRRAR